MLWAEVLSSLGGTGLCPWACQISRVGKTAGCKCDASLRAATRGKGKLKQKEKSRETKSEREGKKKGKSEINNNNKKKNNWQVARDREKGLESWIPFSVLPPTSEKQLSLTGPKLPFAQNEGNSGSSHS